MDSSLRCVNLTKVLFFAVAILMLHPAVSGATALFSGIALALIFGKKIQVPKQYQNWLLQLSIVGLGFGMNLNTVASTGLDGLVYTAIGITFAILFGFGLSRLLGTEKEISLLLSVGTAICGGSAIAAVAPVIRAKNESITVAMSIVFMLNASALLFFPWLGHFFGLSEHQFGLFSALAIHDTSSVVATSLQYGPEALLVATSVKLARALWIVPVTLIVGMLWKSKEKGRPKIPYFILGFLATAALITWLPDLAPAGRMISDGAKRSLVLALFFIGSGLTLESLKSVGLKPFLLGIVLWAVIGTLTLTAIKSGLIY
jgi:uncharacterized integral membrane protein (TIGR00698 family)